MKCMHIARTNCVLSDDESCDDALDELQHHGKVVVVVVVDAARPLKDEHEVRLLVAY